MKTIHWYLNIGYAGAEHTGTIEVEDDATDEEIEEAVNDVANNYIDIGWSVEGE